MTRLYTLWARMREDEGAWMIAAEDEFSWEGGPERCQTAFDAATRAALQDGYLVREVVLTFDQEHVEAHFRAAEVVAAVLPKGTPFE